MKVRLDKYDIQEFEPFVIKLSMTCREDVKHLYDYLYIGQCGIENSKTLCFNEGVEKLLSSLKKYLGDSNLEVGEL